MQRIGSVVPLKFYCRSFCNCNPIFAWKFQNNIQIVQQYRSPINASRESCPRSGPNNEFKLEKRIAANLSLSDEEFVYNVNCDIADYLEKRRTNCVLLFPPVNNYRRFLIHRSCENYREEYDLFTFSVGQGPHRRTVICFKSQLLDPIKFTAASSLETRKTAQVKSWRSGGEKIESATTSSLWSPPSASQSSTLSTKTTKRDIAATTTTNSSSMGVEKHLDSSSSASARLNKSHSVDIYRPPALRRNLESIDNDNQQQQQQQHNQQQQQQQQQQEHVEEQQQQILPIQPNDTNCISAKPLPPAVSNPSETIQSCCNGIDTATTATSSSTSCSSNQRQVRRERRPDRAVYVPRARRSQTTPPAVSTQPQAHLQPPQHQQAIPVTEINNQLTSWTATSSLSSGTINTTTTNTISTSTTGTCKSPSGEKSSSGSNSRRSNKDRVSGNGGRKEKSSSKRHSIDENERSNPHKSNNNSINNHNTEEETAVRGSGEQRKHLHLQHRVDKQSSSMPVGSVNLNGLSNCNDKNALLVKDCDITNPKEFPDSTNLTNSKKSVNNAASDVKKQVLSKMSTTFPPTPVVPEPFIPAEIPETVGNLRIEDALMSGGERSEKCDRDAEELLRASKEINRSNRRIIKQTFNSDVLEIPDKTVFDSSSVVKRITKNGCKNVVNTMASGTDEDEIEEGDWDSMYDDSGDCLHPKILQELTASVGKVKIELPKMDYSAYLTKQSILNDEEFPHVLEVSNFPVEFKNQDLLMVFSQYKESGFDIKWVDDTHALAVFSSSQIAAEVLAMGHPFVVLKPLAEATVESRLKAKKCSASLQPYRPRPETCAALARRLVTGALGVRLKTAAQERENEKRVLREAKERKLLAAKQRDEAWES